MKMVRCAIYTRKSSEEGLEQDFNSLDAQRAACSAYILSQASEGWSEIAGQYDDGGISGGTLERPALQRLLADVAAGRIDIIVVYKVDRLTRSLLDFARLVEAFDAANASFVSVTQSFNTTTSMGRLTLNMLLSFAQFEREVTAERIRDKIAASKARGMWMGGIPPLGYRPDGRTLAIIPEQAALVEGIFRRYLDIGNVRLLAEALKKDGILAPERSTATGKKMGGRPLTRGQLYLMLGCRTYRGEVRHHDAIHPGLHEAIIGQDLWDAVQAMLASNRQGHRSRHRAVNPSLLAGLVTDEGGEPLVPVHATKGKIRYRYYVSRALQHGESGEGMRIPARELENIVIERLLTLCKDPLQLAMDIGMPLDRANLPAFVASLETLAGSVRRRDSDTLRSLLARIEVGRDGITMDCRCRALAPDVDIGFGTESRVVSFRSDVRLTRSGRALRLVHDGDARTADRMDLPLVRLIVTAHHWWKILQDDPVDIKTLSARENVSASWMTRVLRLAFLSPKITQAILSGQHRQDLDATALLTTGNVISPSWSRQETRLLPAGRIRQSHLFQQS